MGEPEQAIQLLQEAEGLVDAQRDPRLFLCLRHNLLCNLTTVAQYDEALRMLPEVEALCRELGNPLDLLRLRWAEARIAAGLGQTDTAPSSCSRSCGRSSPRAASPTTRPSSPSS